MYWRRNSQFHKTKAIFHLTTCTPLLRYDKKNTQYNAKYARTSTCYMNTTKNKTGTRFSISLDLNQ